MTDSPAFETATETSRHLPSRPASGSDGGRAGERGDKPLIQSLLRADAILTAISEAGPGGAPLAGIAEHAGLNKSTAHHLLKTLISLDFVEQSDAGRHYRIGLRPFQLTWQSQRLRELSGEHHEAMMRLCHRTGETVNLTVPHGEGALVLSSLEGRGVVRASSYTGALWPLTATASGKVILAHLGAAQRSAILAGPLPRFTTHTIAEPQALGTEIDTVARRGYATEVEEHELGAACVAVPVFGKGRAFAGAISIAAPVARMAPSRLRELARVTAEEIARPARRPGPTSGG